MIRADLVPQVRPEEPVLRKTTALLSASTLGVVAVAAGVAAPASADMITGPQCETFEDHLSDDPSVFESDWYMECVPQYGVGKAEFTLEAPDSGFPDDFDVLTAARTNSPDASGVAPYYDEFFGDSEDALDSWINPADAEETAPGVLRVGAMLVAPVSSVGRLDETPAAVSTACELDAFPEGSESVTFVSNFAPVTTTFSFVGADGTTYEAPVTATPEPTYYVYTDVDDADPETMETVVCITDTHQTVSSDSEDGSSFTFAGLITVPPYVWFDAIVDGTDELPGLGAFRFAAVDAAEPEPQPELAATGAENVLPLGVAAGALGALGALLFAFSRRRRPQE